MILIGLASFQIYLKAIETYKSAGGAAQGNKTITMEKVSTAFKVFIGLEIDNSECNNDLKYKVVNPKGVVLTEGIVKAHDKAKIDTKKYKGDKGDWKIQFEKTEETSYFQFKYNFKTSNNLI